MVCRFTPLLLLIGLLSCRRGEPIEKVGDRGGVQGGGFTMSISNEFRRDSLQLLYERAISDSSMAALQEFTCGDDVPAMRYELQLKPAGEWNERLVNVGYAPDLDSSFHDRCLTKGISYVFHELLAAIDHGPPIDYGYKNPSTGQPLGPLTPIQNRKPICRCDLRASGREWVAYSEKAAAELR